MKQWLKVMVESWDIKTLHMVEVEGIKQFKQFEVTKLNLYAVFPGAAWQTSMASRISSYLNLSQ